MEWDPISKRIIDAWFESKFQKTTIIQANAPTNGADEDRTKDQACQEKVDKRESLQIGGKEMRTKGQIRKRQDEEPGSTELQQ